MFSTALQDVLTIIKNNDKNHSENKMVRNMLEKNKVPNNSEMDACKRILFNTHGHNLLMQWFNYPSR